MAGLTRIVVGVARRAASKDSWLRPRLPLSRHLLRWQRGKLTTAKVFAKNRRVHVLCLLANSPGRIVEARTIAFPAIVLRRIDTEGFGMPTWAKVLLGIIVVIVAIVVAVFSFTSGMTKTADEFFAAARNGNVEQAYQYTSPDFQAGTTRDELAAFLRANALDKVTDTSWSSRAVNGRTGKLEGSLTIATGGIVPIKVDLTKGADGWKILAIRKAAAGLQSGDTAQQLPSEQQQVALVSQSMALFTDAIAAGSMAEFHNHIANLWARQASVEDLNQSYASLYPAGSAFQVLQTMTPVFDEPAHISDQGLMNITGHYRTTPQRMTFVLTYLFEGTEWKLAGLSVETEPVAAE